MDELEMILQLQDLRSHCRDFSADNEAFQKDVEALNMAIGYIIDTMERIQVSEEIIDSTENEKVGDISKNPQFTDKEIYLHLIWHNEDPYDPVINPIWEGYIKDVPEKYINFNITGISRSMKDYEKGIEGFYISCRNEYTVYIKETTTKKITLNAESHEAAYKAAKEMYVTSDVITSDDKKEIKIDGCSGTVGLLNKEKEYEEIPEI